MTAGRRKLVVFVPPDALDAVRDALFAAGAGRIGDYERCSWYTEGTGTFLGGVGTDPAIGEPGREVSVPYVLSSISWGCISREFSTMALRRTSPITNWLRALARAVHAELGGPGVGVVGMCFTGGFALAMMVDDTVMAPVLSQPSLPFALSRAHRRDLGISDDDLARVKERVRASAVDSGDGPGVCLLALRFTGDKLSPADRFQRLRDELGDGVVTVEIDSSPGNAWGIKANAHSVLTEELVADDPDHPTRHALDQVLELFRTRLRPGA